jgi:phosphoribosylaminoimidazole-succinocarboxamide synthase
VRDIYDVDADHLLIVTTDRLSAFDVVLPDPIPLKGTVLTQISRFWFEKTRHIVPNHLTDVKPQDVVADPEERAQLAGRSMVVRKLDALPIEAVVRGYLIGSGFKDYQLHGSVCGIALPRGLQMAQALPEPIFTPAWKAPAGQHDQNIDFEAIVKLVGREHATLIRRIALEIYRFAAEHARARDIIIADTKFEFGRTPGGLVIADEVLTPDSSRFWPKDKYRPGGPQDSFDKQYVRDYLEAIKWNKQPPAPALPPEVAARTGEKYVEAYTQLTGHPLPA